MSEEPRPPDVLFLGHEASRTGAPLMFLYFLRWLRDHGARETNTTVVLRRVV